MNTTFIFVILIILGHFGQASKDKKSKTKTTVRKFFRKRTFKQSGSQKEKKRGQILFRGDGPSSAESVELENKRFLEVVTVRIPINTSCGTMKKMCMEDHGGHCTDDGEKCCEIDACVVCFAGWTGPNCNIRKVKIEIQESHEKIKEDPYLQKEKCWPTNPCKNGGICNGVDGSCHCTDGWSGATCETPKESKGICTPNPCKNGGVCNGNDGSCHCSDGWSGATCQTPEGQSSDTQGHSRTEKKSRSDCPCKNGGVCNGVDGSCYCSDGWSGATCETPEGEEASGDQEEVSSDEDQSRRVACHPNPCKNGGVCNGVNGKCHCINNYTGDQCETATH